MSRFRPWLAPALVFVGMVCLSIELSAAGGFLRVRWCFGGGSECDGVQPLWESGGRLLAAAGAVVFFSAPVIAGLVAWRLHARGRRFSQPVGPESG